MFEQRSRNAAKCKNLNKLKKMNICYRGVVHNCSGYAQLRHLFIRLARRGHHVSIIPFNSRDDIKLLYSQELKKLENNDVKKPYISITSGIGPQLQIDPEAVYNIGHSMFETTEIPERWVEFYNQFDEIWVPSKFCEKAFDRKNIRCRVSTIPYGVDESYITHEKKSHDLFTFLSVGQWIDRKGWDLLIQAYVAEFMGNYNVRLCIKTHNDIKTNEQMIREYLSTECRNASYMPRIMIKNQKLDEESMPFLYQEADCVIVPSRGEAFCLPLLESMALGIPVITTNFGGQVDFVNEDVGWLIEIKQLRHLSERLCKINAGYKNLWFAEPEIDDIKKVMRYVFEHKDEVREKGKRSQELVMGTYTWEKITDYVEKRLNEICRALGDQNE